MASPVSKKRKSSGDAAFADIKKSSKGKKRASQEEKSAVGKSADLIAGQVSRKQIVKAVTALLAHVRSKLEEAGKTNDLLSEQSQAVWLQITTRRVGEERRLKPIEIPLAHPYHQEEGGVCLITKDPQREYKDKLEALGLYPGIISRVVGVSKLKGKFKPFEARRQLVQDHSLFLADDRVITLLPQLCGKVFFERKRIPVPLNLARSKDLKRDLIKLSSATYLNLNTGSCSNLKIGTTNMSNQDIIDNLALAIEGIAKVIPRSWENIQVLHLKTNTSIALPLWNADMSQGIAMNEEDRAKVEDKKKEEERIKKRKIAKDSAKVKQSLALDTVESALQKKRLNQPSTSQMPTISTQTADVFDAEDTQGLDLSDQQPLKSRKTSKML